MQSPFYRSTFVHHELDTLRFFAFFGVFLTHSMPHEGAYYTDWGYSLAVSEVLRVIATTGTLGVDLFFCLSAFLITSILLREHHARGSIDVPAFWMRRILRIWPLYYAALAATWLVVPYVLPNDDLPFRYLIGFAFFFGNWVCVFGGYPQSACAPLWSVAIEEQFYILWPAVLAWVGPRRMVPLCLILIAVGWAARLYLVTTGTREAGMWCNTLCHLDSIALGALCAHGASRGMFRFSRGLKTILVGAGIALPAAVIAVYGESAFWLDGSLVLYPASAVGSAAIVLGIYRPDGAPSDAGAVAGAVRYLGRISYGLYVFHFFAILLTHQYFGDVDQGLDGGASLLTRSAAFALTVVMAMLSYHGLERPFLRLKHGFNRS